MYPSYNISTPPLRKSVPRQQHEQATKARHFAAWSRVYSSLSGLFRSFYSIFVHLGHQHQFHHLHRLPVYSQRPCKWAVCLSSTFRLLIVDHSIVHENVKVLHINKPVFRERIGTVLAQMLAIAGYLVAVSVTKLQSSDKSGQVPAQQTQAAGPVQAGIPVGLLGFADPLLVFSPCKN